MQAINNAERNSEKLYDILTSMDFDISQSQCSDVVSEMSKNQISEKVKNINVGCLDVIAKLEGYEGWSAYKDDISENIIRVEQFVDEMIEGDAERSYEKFTQRFEEKYLVNFSRKKFLRDVREIGEEFGQYQNRQFLGCLTGDRDPVASAKYPHELKYVWRFVFEKKEVIGLACIYRKNETYYVSGFRYF